MCADTGGMELFGHLKEAGVSGKIVVPFWCQQIGHHYRFFGYPTLAEATAGALHVRQDARQQLKGATTPLSADDMKPLFENNTAPTLVIQAKSKQSEESAEDEGITDAAGTAALWTLHRAHSFFAPDGAATPFDFKVTCT